MKKKEREIMSGFLHKPLSDRVLGAAFSVFRELGYGFLESAYEEAFCYELTLQGIPFERQKVYPLFYKDVLIGEYRSDLVVDGLVLVELKAVRGIAPYMEAQLINYLKVSGIEVGYLINFGRECVAWKRLVLGRE